MTDRNRSPTPADVAREIAAEEREMARGDVPDRHDTHGGPTLGVTTDGRTGPADPTPPNGPASTLRTEDDRSSRGEVMNHLAEEREKNDNGG